MKVRLSFAWLAWVAGTTIAFAAGMGIALVVALVVGLATDGPWGGTAGAALVAFAVSAAQYGVLRLLRADVRFAPWTLGSALAAGLGWLAGQCAALPLRGAWTSARGFAVYFVIGAAIGGAVGVVQRLAWRERMPIPAGWIGATALGWGLGLAMFSCSSLSHALRIAGVIAPGIITASALVLLGGTGRFAPPSVRHGAA